MVARGHESATAEERLRRGRRVRLTLIGYIAFLDPPKETTAEALAAWPHGVAVKLLTGDNELVAAKVCRDVGLPKPHHPWAHRSST